MTKFFLALLAIIYAGLIAAYIVIFLKRTFTGHGLDDSSDAEVILIVGMNALTSFFGILISTKFILSALRSLIFG